MDQPLQFETIRVGNRWISQGRTVTETDVVNFAGLSGDFDPLHVDHEYAQQTPFARPIAHGLLGLAWVAGLASHTPRVATHAFLGIEDWEFHRPVYVGDTLHVVTEVVDKQPRGRRRGLVSWKKGLVNQHGDVVQSGLFHTLVATAEGVQPSNGRATAR